MFTRAQPGFSQFAFAAAIAGFLLSPSVPASVAVIGPKSEVLSYELEDGTQYVVDDDGSLLTGVWLLVAEDEEPCDRPVIVYPDGEPPF